MKPKNDTTTPSKKRMKPRVSPRSGAVADPVTGMYKAKPRPPVRMPSPETQEASVNEYIRKYRNPKKEAMAIIARANAGEEVALARVERATKGTAADGASAYDLDLLNLPENTTLQALLSKSSGKPLSSSDQDALAWLLMKPKYWTAGDPIPYTDDEPEEKEEDQEDMTPLTLPPAPPSPLPIPRAAARPERIQHLPPDEVLNRAQPSTGGHRRSMMGIHNDTGGYSDPSERAYDIGDIKRDLDAREAALKAPPAPDKKKQRTN